MQGELLVLAGIVLVIVGILLVVTGSLISIGSKGEVEGGGVILIGPIPIIFGTSGRAAVVAAALAVVIIVLVIVLYMVQRSGLA